MYALSVADAFSTPPMLPNTIETPLLSCPSLSNKQRPLVAFTWYRHTSNHIIGKNCTTSAKPSQTRRNQQLTFITINIGISKTSRLTVQHILALTLPISSTSPSELIPASPFISGSVLTPLSFFLAGLPSSV